MKKRTMEYIDIFDKNNNPTGKVKEKQQAHDDGNFHRTAHIWIINDKNKLLLQKRSASKKSHPNCQDISVAGHIRAGESVLEGVIRELKEELGVEVEERELQYIATVKSTKNPKNKKPMNKVLFIIISKLKPPNIKYCSLYVLHINYIVNHNQLINKPS